MVDNGSAIIVNSALNNGYRLLQVTNKLLFGNLTNGRRDNSIPLILNTLCDWAPNINRSNTKP